MKIQEKYITEMHHSVEAFSMLLLIPLLSGAFGILLFPYLTSQM
jgi:fructose-specific phosphotransferase system IIC component